MSRWEEWADDLLEKRGIENKQWYGSSMDPEPVLEEVEYPPVSNGYVAVVAGMAIDVTLAIVLVIILLT